MNEELYWLSLILLQTALMFVPYVMNMFYQQGIFGALRYYEPNKKPLSDWAQKARSAHVNAVENLVILVPAALAYIFTAGTSREGHGIVLSLQVYFFARLAHYIVYTLKVNYIRTVFFLTGWVATICVICKLMKVI